MKPLPESYDSRTSIVEFAPVVLTGFFQTAQKLCKSLRVAVRNIRLKVLHQGHRRVGEELLPVALLQVVRFQDQNLASKESLHLKTLLSSFAFQQKQVQW